MHVDIERKDHYWILVCKGNTMGLVLGPIPDVMRAINQGARDIILDFESLEYISNTGIKGLEDTFILTRERGVNLGIAAPKRGVRRMLQLNGIRTKIPIFANRLEAITKLDLIQYQSDSWQEKSDMLLILRKELNIGSDLRKAMKKHPLKPMFRMHPVRTSSDAIDFLHKERTECIMIDSSVPIFKVAGFIEKILNDEIIPEIPILVVTTDKRLKEAEMMIRHGAHEILRFPFVPIETATRIHNLISNIKDHEPWYPPEGVEQPFGIRA